MKYLFYGFLGLLLSGSIVLILTFFSGESISSLFQGLSLLALLFIILLIKSLISVINSVLETFRSIQEQQGEIVDKAIAHTNEAIQAYLKDTDSKDKNPFGDFLGSDVKVSIIDLDGNNADGIGGLDSEYIKNLIKNKFQLGDKDLLDTKDTSDEDLAKNLNRKQLESMLLDAVSKDDFEKAERIKNMITKLDDKK